MNKWVVSALAIGTAIAVGLTVRQVARDLSDRAILWKSVTDDPGLTN